MKTLFALLVVGFYLSWSLPVHAVTPIPLTVQVDGLVRRALVFPPPSGPSEKTPVVLAFHGHGGNMNGAARAMALQNAWPEAIVVYPQGVPIPTDVDPQGLKPGWQREPGQAGNRDLKFVDALLAKLREQYPIDDQRIFAVGFSNGAGFTYLLWLERAQAFAGFAAVAGKSTLTGKFTVPKPAVQIGGQADKLVPPSESKIAFANVRKLNGCPDRGQPCGAGCTRYPSTKNAPVVQVIHPGPHVYPPQATKLIVSFFKEFASGGPMPSASTAAQTATPKEMAADEEPGEEMEVADETSAVATEFGRNVENVTFPSGGFTLRGWIYKPQGNGPFPTVVWNHGSEKNPKAHPDLGMFYTQHGYVLFLPVRHGHDGSPGPYIQDTLKEFKAHTQNKQLVQQKAVELQREYNRDVVAAIGWLKKQPYVDPNRIAVTGVSYGGIQTLLTAEKNLGLRAAIPFAPGAMSWANKQLQEREIEAVRNAKVPLFLLQAQNDYSTGPSEILAPLIRKKSGANRAKLYPAFGTTHADGHAGFACRESGIAIWASDVLDFLKAAGM